MTIKPLLVIFSALAMLAACGSDDDEGSQCKPCRASGKTCDSGLSCYTFTSSTGGDKKELCSDSKTDSCPSSSVSPQEANSPLQRGLKTPDSP